MLGRGLARPKVQRLPVLHSTCPHANSLSEAPLTSHHLSQLHFLSSVTWTTSGSSHLPPASPGCSHLQTLGSLSNARISPRRPPHAALQARMNMVPLRTSARHKASYPGRLWRQELPKRKQVQPRTANSFASRPQGSSSLPFRLREHQAHTHKKVFSKKKNCWFYTLP